MPRGNYTLALSQDGVPVEADPVDITGDGTLEGNYTSRSGIRTAGWIIAIGSLVAGSALLFSSGPDDGDDSSLFLGLGVMLGGGLIGAIMTFLPDKAEIRFIPGSPVGLSHPSDLRADSGSRARGFDPGLSLAMAF